MDSIGYMEGLVANSKDSTTWWHSLLGVSVEYYQQSVDWGMAFVPWPRW